MIQGQDSETTLKRIMIFGAYRGGDCCSVRGVVKLDSEILLKQRKMRIRLYKSHNLLFLLNLVKYFV